MNKHEYTGERPFWYDGKMVNEVGFCEDFLQKHPMVRVGGSFFTKDGRITDEESVRKEIYEMLRPYLNCGLAKRASSLLETLRLEAYAPNLPVHEDRLHVANGTLFLSGEFTEQKDFCRNRLPVKYDPNAPQPVTWLHFLSELLEDDPDDRFVEACHMLDCTQYMLDLLTIGSQEDRTELVSDMMKDNKITLLQDHLREIKEESNEQT